MQQLLTWRIRLLLYLSSLSALLFAQNYSVNVCSFIDGLRTQQILLNLSIVFFMQIIYRELLYWRFDRPWKRVSLARQGYYLSMVSWVMAGITAMVIHAVRYPDFPLGSHIKLLSSYLILGGGVLSQLEYMLFEKRVKNIKTVVQFDQYGEKIANRILESFLIFTLAPSVMLLLIIARYRYEGLLEESVLLEVSVIGLLFLVAAVLVATLFRHNLKKDTQAIVTSIKSIKGGNYHVKHTIRRADELGEISDAITAMALSIAEGIDEISHLNEEITSTQKEVVYTMGAIAETRSKETGNHVKRVAAYSELLALKAGISKDEAALLRLASPMHDIGKVAIPDTILNKPGKLTEDEFEIMKTHAVMGYEMLKYSDREILKAASIVAHEHHEKYDGSGYPRGIKGEEIHIYGRITALADVFDALGSDRVYKKAWEDAKIFELLRDQRGKHFDPRLITLFFENIEEIFAIREEFKDMM